MPQVATIPPGYFSLCWQKVIALCDVDDILFDESKDQDSDTIVNVLKKDGIMMWKGGSAEGFLWVDIKLIGSTHLLLTQAGLTKHIVEDLSVCSSFSIVTCTPAEMSPHPKDSMGAPAPGTFNCAAVVCVLL